MDAATAHAPAHGQIHEWEEEHHEKKPVLKKVKDKVKKIKDTIGKKKPGHGDEAGEHDEDDDEDNGPEEDDDDEREVDPEIHGAPNFSAVYESETASKLVAGRDENPSPGFVSLGTVIGSGPAARNPGFGDRTTGRDEVGESRLIRSFEAMAVLDPPEGQKSPSTTPPSGTHDQFKPEESYARRVSSAAAAAKDAAVSAAVGSTEYAKKIASTAYEKAVTGGKGRDGTTAGEKEKVEDKGVSVKEYLAGKLRPGEEDRALSEVISEAMQKREEEAAPSPAAEAAGGRGMVERIKGAVTSLLGAGAGPGGKASRDSPVTDAQLKEAQTVERSPDSRQQSEGSGQGAAENK